MQKNINKIISIQNNNYPYLFVDKIIELDPLNYGIGKKCFTSNEWYFDGQFEDEVFVPEFIQIEALIQMLVITIQYETKYEGEILNDVKFKNIIFLKSIEPGCSMIIKVKVINNSRGIIKGISEGYVDEILVCSMECFIAVVSELNKYSPNLL
jgi:3-hydroxyacyl-[acyl-carrier-protein] dehydratase